MLTLLRMLRNRSQYEFKRPAFQFGRRAFLCEKYAMKYPWLLLSLYKRQQDAVTAVEYSLIASGISLTIMFGVFFFGEAVLGMFTGMLEEVSDFVDRFMDREDG